MRYREISDKLLYLIAEYDMKYIIIDIIYVHYMQAIYVNVTATKSRDFESKQSRKVRPLGSASACSDHNLDIYRLR